MPKKSASQHTEEANTYLLEERGIDVKLTLIGNRLHIRKTLPPDSSKGHKERQQYTLCLFLSADVDGIKQAKDDAMYLNWLLANREFTWEKWRAYLKRTKSKRKLFGETTIAQLVERFHQHFLAHPPKRKKKGGKERDRETVWREDVAQYLNEKWLKPWDEALTEDTLMGAIEKAADKPPTLQAVAFRLQQFVRFLDFEVDIPFNTYINAYDAPPPVEEGKLPTDRQILECYYSIPDPKWQAAYGSQATFGLRNHEVLMSALSTITRDENGIYLIQVPEEAKTGFRWVPALYPEWVEKFGLLTAELPEIDTRGKPLEEVSLQQIGNQVTVAFRRFKLPLTPYLLRHAWAIRSIRFGLTVQVAAMAMGHSEKIHVKHYWRYLDKARAKLVFKSVFESILSNPNRPHPPQL